MRVFGMGVVMWCRGRHISDTFRHNPQYPLHVAAMSHGGFRMAWKPLEMLVSMSHYLVQHEAGILS